MHKLTRLDLFDMEGLHDEPQLVTLLSEVLLKLHSLQELGLENCLLQGYEVQRIVMAL